jgi:hypothetical protein
MAFPLFLTKRGIRVILSSIVPTREESCNPGLARSDADIMILLQALSVYDHTVVVISISPLRT